MTAALVCAFAAPAAAEPTVEFAENGDLSVSLDSLVPPAPQATAALKLDLVNRLAVAQEVRVRVVGLRPVDGKPETYGAQLFDSAGIKQAIDPGEVENFPVPVTRPPGGTRPSDGGYVATIIAVGKRGGAVRRTLTLTVPSPSQDAGRSTPVGTGVAADTTGAVTLSGVNFSPSLLTPAGPAVVVLGFICALLAWALWGKLGRFSYVLFAGGVVGCVVGATVLDAFGGGAIKGRDEWVAVGVPAVLALVLCIGFNRRQDKDTPAAYALLAGTPVLLAVFLAIVMVESHGENTSGQPGTGIVSIRGLAVANSVPKGRIGAVADKASHTGEVNVVTAETRRELEVEGLEEAGTYTGKVDLNGAAGKGQADATVNIRDWWLWPFIAIGLGVAIAYAIRRYYDRGRSLAASRVALDEAWSEVSGDDSRFMLEAAGRSYADLRMTKTARARLARGRELADRGDAVGAAKVAADLIAYAGEFHDLRLDVATLDRRLGEIQTTYDAPGHGFDVPANQVVTLRDGREAVDEPFDRDDRDDSKRRLTDRQGDVSKQKKLAESVIEVYPTITRHYDEAKKLLPSSEYPTKFENAAIEALTKPTPEDIAKVAEAHAKDYADFQKAVNDAVRDDNVDMNLEMVAEFIPDVVSSTDGGVTFPERGGAGPRPSGVTLTSVAITPTDDIERTSAGDGDDEFELSVGFPSSHAPDVQWQFDDGTPTLTTPSAIVDGHATAELRHRFGGSAATPQITVTAGLASTSEPFQIDRPGRSTVGRRRLALADAQVTLIAGLLVLGSGMISLYFIADGWGSDADYLTAILWGGVGTGGLAYVINLVSRKLDKAS